MSDKLKEYRDALETILIFTRDDEDGENIEAIENIANRALEGE